MSTKRWNDILFFGETGLAAGFGFFYVLHLQRASFSTTVAGYALSLGAVLGVALYLFAIWFELGVFFRYHLLIVVCAIVFGVRQNSLVLFSTVLFVAVSFPPLLWFSYKKTYTRSGSDISESLPWRVCHHPFALLVTVFLLLTVVTVDALFLIGKKPKYSLRSEPIAFSEAEIEDKLNVVKDTETFKNLNATVWRPRVYVDNEYRDNADGTVTDHATGLMWQQSGSENYMVYKDVPSYVEKINQEKLGGYDDWRLPTIEELASLLEKEEKNGLYIDPVFDRKQWWGWSSDKRLGGGVWGASFYYGGVYWYDEHYDDGVRLVRRGQ